MSSSSSLNPLTKGQQDFCTYAGLFGVLLSATCLIQHFIFVIPTWISHLIIIPYLLTIATFTMLALQKAVAPLLLIISTVFILVVTLLWLLGGSFSLVLLLLLLYSVIITIFIYIEQIQHPLKQKQRLEKEEDQLWKGKL